MFNRHRSIRFKEWRITCGVFGESCLSCTSATLPAEIVDRIFRWRRRAHLIALKEFLSGFYPIRVSLLSHRGIELSAFGYLAYDIARSSQCPLHEVPLYRFDAPSVEFESDEDPSVPFSALGVWGSTSAGRIGSTRTFPVSVHCWECQHWIRDQIGEVAPIVTHALKIRPWDWDWQGGGDYCYRISNGFLKKIRDCDEDNCGHYRL